MEFNKENIMKFIKKHRRKIALAMGAAIILLGLMQNYGIVKMSLKTLNDVTFVLFVIGLAMIFVAGKDDKRKMDEDAQGPDADGNRQDADGNRQDQITDGQDQIEDDSQDQNTGNDQDQAEDSSKDQGSDNKTE